MERRRRLTDAAFLDLLGATNLLPGPNATELAIHLKAALAFLAHKRLPYKKMLIWPRCS